MTKAELETWIANLETQIEALDKTIFETQPQDLSEVMRLRGLMRLGLSLKQQLSDARRYHRGLFGEG